MVESLFDPYHRARFLSLLEKSFAYQGVLALPPFKEPRGASQEDAVNRILSHLAEAVRVNLAADQALVALYRDPEGSVYTAGTAGQSEGDRVQLATAMNMVATRAMAEPGTLCAEIDLAVGRQPQAHGVPGRVLAAPVRVDDTVCGVVMVARLAAGEPLPAEKVTLGLVAVLLASAIGHLADEIVGEERLRSLAHGLSAALDARDPNSRGHSDRVAMYAMAIVNEMKYDENDPLYQETRSRIMLAALLHDIGKIGVPDGILLKPDKLTEEEYDFIKRHSIMGAEIVTACEGLKDLVPGVLYHHENFDGSGYPFGIAGERIPILARVIALADAFDAITSDRPFHAAASQDEALEILGHRVSNRYDPSLLEALIRAHERGALKHIRLPSRARHAGTASDLEVENMYGSHLRTIPTLPSALAALTSLLDDPDAALRDVANILSSDQGIASRVLRLVNSAYYGLPQMVATIPLAATMLGAKAIKHHVVSIALTDLMNALGGGHEEYEVLWRHALRTSAWAKALAKSLGDADPEEAFTAGLVHDIGKTLALRLRPRDYAKVIREAERTGTPLMGVEEQVIGFDHTQIGGWAAAKWTLPESLVNCIRWHHQPENVGQDCLDVYRLARIVHIADIVARSCIEAERVPATSMLKEANPQIVKDLGGLAETIERLRSTVEAQQSVLEETFACAAVSA